MILHLQRPQDRARAGVDGVDDLVIVAEIDGIAGRRLGILGHHRGGADADVGGEAPSDANRLGVQAIEPARRRADEQPVAIGRGLGVTAAFERKGPFDLHPRHVGGGNPALRLIAGHGEVWAPAIPFRPVRIEPGAGRAPVLIFPGHVAHRTRFAARQVARDGVLFRLVQPHGHRLHHPRDQGLFDIFWEVAGQVGLVRRALQGWVMAHGAVGCEQGLAIGRRRRHSRPRSLLRRAGPRHGQHHQADNGRDHGFHTHELIPSQG
jgi:hypothetical protein